MPFAQHAIVACWLAFVGFWLLTALGAKRTLERRPLAERLEYGLPTLIGAWLLFRGASDPGFLGDRVLPRGPAIGALALALALGGLALAIWARLTLGGNWSAQVTFKEGHELIRHGPYAHVRHPIYSAILLMLLGSALAAGIVGAVLGLLLIGVGMRLKMAQEEALMSAHFPAEYAAYRSEVAALVPRLF